VQQSRLGADQTRRPECKHRRSSRKTATDAIQHSSQSSSEFYVSIIGQQICNREFVTRMNVRKHLYNFHSRQRLPFHLFRQLIAPLGSYEYHRPSFFLFAIFQKFPPDVARNPRLLVPIIRIKCVSIIPFWTLLPPLGLRFAEPRNPPDILDAPATRSLSSASDEFQKFPTIQTALAT